MGGDHDHDWTIDAAECPQCRAERAQTDAENRTQLRIENLRRLLSGEK